MENQEFNPLIGSVGDFLKRIDDYFQRRREDFYSPDLAGLTFFRGHSDSRYNLEPSLFRGLTSEFDKPVDLYRSEQAMIRDSLQLLPNDFSSNAFDLLCKMQHFGLPTRLLDVTSNPLVALYFATSGSNSNDGEVIIVPPLPTVSSDNRIILTIAEFAVRGNWDFLDLEEFTLHLHRKYGFENDPSNTLSALTVPYSMVRSEYSNRRMRAQQGAFMMFGVGGKPTEREDRLAFQPSRVDRNTIDKARNVTFQYWEGEFDRMIIPGNCKTKIRKQLDRIGINRSTLFPEIEHQLGYISDSYKTGLRGSEFGWEDTFRSDDINDFLKHGFWNSSKD